MKLKGKIELEQGLKQIDILPLINVIFLLLIFFILTPILILPPGIKVNLPRVVTSESISSDNVEVIVNSENYIYLDGNIVNVDSLRAILKQAASRAQTVLIKADKRASLEKVVEICDMSRESGIKQINVATNQGR
ncbi:MAG: biopolymer transporter ExbD [Candidatus Omnitrophica bacterium]|nr:biopolymer transporter ExbD [Candidatus Omnitrophota bacterium]MBU1869489.1 biopolymer transporter ExbD [Candidatus Omnitrophota bacterium]